jgi:hypothetical protein
VRRTVCGSLDAAARRSSTSDWLENVLPVDIDCFSEWRFFDDVGLEVLKVILIDIDGIVLFDGVFDGLDVDVSDTRPPSSKRDSLVRARVSLVRIRLLFLSSFENVTFDPARED